MVEKPDQFSWSSYREYLSRIPRSSSSDESSLITAKRSGKLKLTPDIILKYFKDKNAALHKEYVEYDLHLYNTLHNPSDSPNLDDKDVANILSSTGKG